MIFRQAIIVLRSCFLGVLLLASEGALREEGVVLARIGQLEDESLAAAKLEIVVLRTSLSEAHRESEMQILVSANARPMTGDQAARFLATTSKPVFCEAQRTPSGLMSIDCRPVSTADDVGQHNSVIQAFDHRLARSRPAPDQFVVIGADRDELIVSVLAFRKWYRDYLLPSSIALSFGERRAGSRGDQFKQEIQLLHIDPIPPSDTTFQDWSRLKE